MCGRVSVPRDDQVEIPILIQIGEGGPQRDAAERIQAGLGGHVLESVVKPQWVRTAPRQAD